MAELAVAVTRTGLVRVSPSWSENCSITGPSVTYSMETETGLDSIPVLLLNCANMVFNPAPSERVNGATFLNGP